MSEANGFGIELEEMRTMVLVSAALVPAVNWVAKAPTGAKMAQRTALASAVVLGLVFLDVHWLRKQG